VGPVVGDWWAARGAVFERGGPLCVGKMQFTVDVFEWLFYNGGVVFEVGSKVTASRKAVR